MANTKFTLAVYTVNRDLETKAYNELHFESMVDVRRYLRHEGCRELNLNTWVNDWIFPRDVYVPNDLRDIFVALDFAVGEHLVQFKVSEWERQEFIAAGWEV